MPKNPKSRLDRFVHDARARVAAGYYATRHGGTARPGFTRSVQGGIIAELKPRSPSSGRLLQRPAADMLRAYDAGGAAAISVLTDPDHFDGELDHLAMASKLRPTLMKDFIVDPAQLICAADHGASAVLLIERLFEDPTDREALVTAAHALGLEVLLEVFDEHDWHNASASAADVIGVNARDLESLAVDRASGLSLLHRIATKRPAIALSGIHAPADANAAFMAGAHGVLVGTALMQAPDARLWLRALRRPLAKVCGLTNQEDLEATLDAGADLVGFVVDPRSPRHVSPMQAQALIELAKGRAATVLVTNHPDDWEVREWCRVTHPDIVQVHGFSPSPEWIHSLHGQGTQTWTAGPKPSPADGHVVDHETPGQGAARDWTVGTMGHQRPWLVAGGIGPEDVPTALTSGAWGVDASSRLETGPGRKDAAKVRAFIEAAHGGPP